MAAHASSAWRPNLIGCEKALVARHFNSTAKTSAGVMWSNCRYCLNALQSPLTEALLNRLNRSGLQQPPKVEFQSWGLKKPLMIRAVSRGRSMGMRWPARATRRNFPCGKPAAAFSKLMYARLPLASPSTTSTGHVTRLRSGQGSRWTPPMNRAASRRGEQASSSPPASAGAIPWRM